MGFPASTAVRASTWAPAVRPLASASITRDITLLVETEARLRESEEQFRSAFDDSAIGMALVSNEGTTLRVNAALANMFGYTLEDAVRTQWHQILHPDEIPEASVVLREIAAGQLASSRAERRCLRRDGTRLITGRPVHPVLRRLRE